MNLIALLIGLVIERLATQLFHLRRLRWIDRIIDAGFRQAGRVANWPSIIPVILITLVLAVPVFAVMFSLGDALLGFPYVFLAIVVLFFSLGPQDIGEDIDEYCKAVEDGEEECVLEKAKAIIESDVPDDERERMHCVEEAVCVQANNRLFAVIFWFVVLGPLGAWTYRVTDLIRRRAVFAAARDEAVDDMSESLRDAAVMLHGWLAWIPARLTAVGYAAAGHFDAAIGVWRAPSEQSTDTPSQYNEHLLARVGVAALALGQKEDETLVERGVRGATAASSLVFRLLLIWAVVIAAMTLYGWTR
ncbi:MAG: regulatory signaling modulator protein AmpE [Woeseiaceae bacterium]|nr:regulatory signaling modulator protein AmpE [Woeseiaceae bacterium]MDX2607484.1 regulatory signaling modulator protein AmpE [Woeseiaceae bacterium]